MTDVAPLPVNGAVFADRRDNGRSLRVSMHAELGLVVLSIWRDDTCVATSQLPLSAVPDLVHALVSGAVATPSMAEHRDTA
jgi:hypothetical protein